MAELFMPFRYRAYRLCSFGVLLVGVLLLFAAQASADPYGRSAYGKCNYKGCVQAATTRATLPSGLEISVNLANGQSIPRSGYTIIVTPLNGAGRTFRQVDFYIDGKLIKGGVVPDQTGTASWGWKPRNYPGTTVKVVITDTDGTVITREFTVALAAGKAPDTLAEVDQPTGVVGVLHTISDRATQVIRALPPPVAYSFPYMLLVLLGANIVLLLLQARHELAEYRKLQQLLERLRAMNDGKKTFMDLAAHYLRTPVTLIRGGIDMLNAKAELAGKRAGLLAVSGRLAAKVEALVQTASSAAADAPQAATTTPKLSVWRQPGLLLPVVLIGGVTFGFTTLSARAGTFTITVVNVATQVLIFCILATLTYIVIRRRQLHRRDTALLRLITKQEVAAATARDNLITGAVKQLQTELRDMQALTTGLPDSQGTSFIRNGVTRLHELMAKCTLVTGLRGAHSDNRFKRYAMRTLLHEAVEPLSTHITQKRVRVVTDEADDIFVQDTSLVSFVLRNLVDNAVAYSPDGGTVHVAVRRKPHETVLSVIDNGPGIPPAKQTLLFKPFSKADGAEVFDHEGLGLSLYIDKLIMTYLGGSVGLESQPGKTTATLHLPVS
jgi:signal transduction histidine kinase